MPNKQTRGNIILILKDEMFLRSGIRQRHLFPAFLFNTMLVVEVNSIRQE